MTELSPSLPKHFLFSQASLQDYVACPRRFQLRYILGVRWPAAWDSSAADWEERAEQGAAFHRLIHQHTVGIPADTLSATLTDDRLRAWWHAYLTTPLHDLPLARRSEVQISVPVGGYRLAARYDLLALDPGQRAVIVDWKTSAKRPTREWLAGRLQTQVYRYVLVEASAHLNGGVRFRPEQVELIYWFAHFPGQVERFSYSAEQHAAVGNDLSALIAEIAARSHPTWPLDASQGTCIYCPYQTLCGRERSTEQEEEVEPEADEDPWEIDLEQIVEIEF